MESILRGLNVAQKAAVTSTASVLQVLAPPGSGKTKTLTSRVAYLLSHHGYAPHDVICCTFTIKASREMRERLRGMIGDEVESKLVLGTFHSICRRYLVKYGHLIDLPLNFGIADSDDSLNIIKRAVKRLNLSIDARAARSRISHRKARGKRLDELSKPVKTLEAQEFTTVFQEYEEALKTANLLDYDDLLLCCVDLLRQHPGCVSNVEALLIDEFQDTNIVQFELMKLLASAKRRITIVGDPDQSIYGFRSAEIENLRRMRISYPETIIINLEENYRSCSSILNLAQEVIEQDTDRPDKKLKSTKRYGTLPVLRRLPNPYEEARWVAAEIKRISTVTANMVQYNDIAILIRSAYLSLHIEKALTSLGIPYRMVGGRRFFDRAEIRILIDYLKTISRPENNSALLSIINTPKRKVGDTTIKELSKAADAEKIPLWVVIQKVLSGKTIMEKKLSKAAELGLQEVVSLIQEARHKMKGMQPLEGPGKLIEHVVTSIKYQNFLQKEYPEDHEERWENVQELLVQAADAASTLNLLDESLPDVEGLAQREGDGVQEILARFLANVSLSTEVEAEDGQGKPIITISTIHSAKGLEWPVVFIPAVYEGSIPHSRAEDTNEERRLLYVAITRAKALLYMTFPVMQQRDEGESILTQFLPTKVAALTSQIGCAMNEQTVKDIADILERDPPSQQALFDSIRTIKESESAEDDIWPADGTHRFRESTMAAAFPGITVQKGQSLADALKFGHSHSQSRQYGTMSSSRTSEGTQLLAYPASLTAGFTTAHHHLITQANIPNIVKRKVESQDSHDSDNKPEKKPKLIKSQSDQGNTHTFFTQGRFNPAQKVPQIPITPSLSMPWRENTFPRMSQATQTTKSTDPSIPIELSIHRPAIGTFGINCNQHALHTTPTSNLNSKRNYYSAFNGSPPRYNGGIKMENENNCKSTLQNPSKGYATSVIQTSASLHSTTIGQLSQRKEHLSAHNPHTHLYGASALNGNQGSIIVKTTMTNLQSSDHNDVRRTLGVKRSMTGWADRKHK